VTIEDGDIDRAFDSVSIERGYRYFKSGRVLSLTAGPHGEETTALVAGSHQQPYTVVLRRAFAGAGALLTGTCTCPMQWDCKHVAAVAFAVASGAGTTPEEEGSGAAEMWIQSLCERHEHAHVASSLESAEHLRYVIAMHPAPYAPKLTLNAFIVPILQNGAMGSPREHALRNLSLGNHKAVSPIDQTIGRLASAAGIMEHYGYGLSPVLVGALLGILMRTGRLHWRSIDEPLLHFEPIDDTRIVWSLGRDDRQRPHLHDRPSTILLPSIPLWYVDPERHVAGTATVDAPAEIAALVAQAPALSAAQAEHAHVALRHVLSGAIDAPAANVEVRAIESDPVPVLRLFTIAAASARGSSAPAHAAAELSFAYGDRVVAGRDMMRELRVEEGPSVTVWPRHTAFEHLALTRLQQQGLRRIGWPYRVEPDRLVLDFPHDANRWTRFVRSVVPALTGEAWRVEVEAAFPFSIIEPDGEWFADVTESEQEQWFDLELGIEVEGRRVSLLPVLLDALSREGYTITSDPATIAKRDEPLLGKLPGGTFVALPAERVARLLATVGALVGETGLTASSERLPVPAARAASLSEISGANVRWDRARSFRAVVDDLDAYAQRRVDLPKSFKATLRAYQRDGVAWLQTLREHGFGGVLADDMGLGKTVQLLAHVAIERSCKRLGKPVLIVAPTSVIPNWRAEIARFLPSARVTALTGQERRERFSEIDGSDIALTSYALLSRDAELLEEREWSMLVLDEAQAIKNPRSRAAAVASSLRAGQRIAMTGTPIENHLEELWSIYNVTVPGLLSDRTRFARVFRTPIETRGDAARRHALAARIKPFFLRRTKEAVATELPEKSEIVQRVELSGAQRDLYEAIRVAMLDRVRDEVSRRGLGRSRIVVLDALLKLRQVCCDPRLLKMPAAQSVKESQKLDALLEMLGSLIEDGRRILLFSQFTSMLDLIKPELDKREFPFVELRGDTLDRETPVARFQRGDMPLFLISPRAGGTGLNLTAADTVIHYDPWWNPAVERQATDRAHRIGQTQHVFIYKLIAEGTVEERILEMQERKGALAAHLFEEASSGTPSFDLNDIDTLFS
jgi:superfamily II DNA or RNA helicase